MDHSLVDPLRTILEELRSNPVRFRRTEGYERLLGLLENGCSATALHELLRTDADFVGDLLWTVCELDDVAPYVDEAVIQLRSSDAGALGYAIEILLRGARDAEHLTVAMHFLESAPTPVFEHAAFVLASQGLDRAREAFDNGGWLWAAQQMTELLHGSATPEDLSDTITSLVDSSAPERAFVGLMLTVLAAERAEGPVLALERSASQRFPSVAVQLRKMFQHRWRTSE
jgi:hypothetical protein